MYKGYVLCLLLGLAACHANNSAPASERDSVPKTKDNSPKILIDSETNLVYTHNELQGILNRNQSFTDEYPPNPDDAYAKMQCHATQEDAGFNSEAGQDEYYLVYSYVLKRRDTTYNPRRERLLKLYRAVNEIYGDLQHGGTYFGHQYNRIPAYVEYDLIRIKAGDSSLNYTNTKLAYLNMLKAEIKTKLSADVDMDPETAKVLPKKADELGLLMKDYTDLRLVRKFQYSNYK